MKTIVLVLLFSSFAVAAPRTVNVPTAVIEKSYLRHPTTGDIYIDLIEVMKKLNERLAGTELISVEFQAKTEEISASDIWLAVNGRMENSLLLMRKDNDSLIPRSLTPLDRTALTQAALVFRGQTSLSQLRITFQ